MSSTQTLVGRVFDLPVHRSSRWIFNCYVIEGDDGPVFVDPGLPSTAQGAIDIASALDWPTPDAPASALCTHGHVDHLSGLPLLVSRLDTAAFLPARCEAYLNGELPRNFDAKTTPRFLPFVGQQPFEFGSLVELAKVSQVGFGGANAAFRFPFATPGFLRDGDPVPGASTWRIITTPGHSDDSVSLYHADSATLISGDAVLTIDGRAWFNPESLDDAQSRQSEEKLRALKVRHLLPGHGLPVSGDPWRRALSHDAQVPGNGLLARCVRRFL